MAFPSTPTIGQQYTQDGRTWQWDGVAWEVLALAGPGVAAGGTAGQYLVKVDSTDYNTNWATLDLSPYAPLASPAFTGNPTAPTAALGDNDTSLATTAFVQQELLSGTANARNLEVYVRNQTGSTLAAGTIVYINGATGNRPTVTPAQANNDANSAQTLGFTKASIANNGFGFVIVRGELENIDTSGLTEGVQLYLSPTTAGTWTTTKPSAPQHLVYVGICVRAHPTQGVILVAVQNGYELDELHDVAIGTLANNDLLAYESSTDLWKNVSLLRPRSALLPRPNGWLHHLRRPVRLRHRVLRHLAGLHHVVRPYAVSDHGHRGLDLLHDRQRREQGRPRKPDLHRRSCRADGFPWHGLHAVGHDGLRPCQPSSQRSNHRLRPPFALSPPSVACSSTPTTSDDHLQSQHHRLLPRV
jgi:hypothetical protein